MTLSQSSTPLWEQSVQFHGHACPGLAIGWRMALQAARLLQIEKSSKDEEVVCITETDACCVDAVQSVLSCTFGKGNLIYKPMGKMAMSFYVRATQKSFRFVLKQLPQIDMSKEEKMYYILEADFDSLFNTQKTTQALPEKARIYASMPCSCCQELTAGPMLHLQDGKPICRQCDPIFI